MTGPADIEGVLVRGRREYAVSSLFRRREVRTDKNEWEGFGRRGTGAL